MKKELLRQILAANVSRRMREVGIETQPVLAKRAGVGQSHISRILNMRQSVGLDVIAAVSGALGCQPWELLTNDEATRRAAIERMLGGPAQLESDLPPAPIVRRQPEKRVAHKRIARKS